MSSFSRLPSVFLSTPSARRATHRRNGGFAGLHHFYPRPPRGGRRPARKQKQQGKEISIHALREEGDLFKMISSLVMVYFYPRPPRGGRLLRKAVRQWQEKFLSTPSARRATEGYSITDNICLISIHALREEGDGVRRDGNRRTQGISIHALREEGDCMVSNAEPSALLFLSTPSARRATFPVAFVITSFCQFLSTPSARRATFLSSKFQLLGQYFYPRPPRGGRRGYSVGRQDGNYFYPRPPRGGRRCDHPLRE